MGLWRSQPTLAWGIELSATDAALRTQFVNWVANVIRWSTPELRQVPDTQTNPLSAAETADIAHSRQADPTGLAWSLIWMVGVGALCLVWMMDCVLWRRIWRRAPVRTVVPRVLVLVLLGLLGWAPWGAIWVPPPQPVHLFDHSDSMALMDAVEHPGSVRFPNPELGESGSPLLPALRRGLAQIPAGVRGEFIISSDGRWTDYAWDAETIQEFVAPHSARVLGRTGDASTVHCGLDTPWIRAGEVVRIQLVHAGKQMNATTWTVDGGTVVAEMRGTRQRESGYTEQDFDLSIPLTRTPGPVTIAATVSGQVHGSARSLRVAMGVRRPYRYPPNRVPSPRISPARFLQERALSPNAASLG